MVKLYIYIYHSTNKVQFTIGKRLDTTKMTMMMIYI
jgi:hypothetical protein